MAAPDPPRPASRRRLAIALGVLVALIIGVRAALPEVLRRLVESKAGEALGRKVTLENVDLGLVAGRVAIEGLEIGGPDLAAPIDPSRAVLRLGGARVRIAWGPLLTGGIHLREIALRAPTVRLERNADGSLAPFVLAKPAAEPEPPPASESDGIDIAIDRISLDGADLQLVRAADAAQIAKLHFDELTVDDLSMQRGVFGIGAVSLRGPDLEVQSELLAAPAPEPAPAAAAAAPAKVPEPPQEPPPAATAAKYHVKSLDVASGRFLWRLPNGEEVGTELEIHASDVGLGGEPFPLRVELRTDQGTHSLEGRLALTPLRFDGEYRWKGMQLAQLARLAEDLPVKIAAGQSDGALQIALRVPPTAGDEPPGLRLQGELRVADLDLASVDGALAVRWKDLAVSLAELALPLGAAAGAPEIHLARIELTDPQLDFTLRKAPGEGPPAGAEAPAPPAEGGEAPAREPSPPPHVQVDALEVTGGRLRFRDTTVKPPVDAALGDLRIRAEGVRWPERDVASLRLGAKGLKGATLAVTGGVKAGAGDVNVALKDLPLTPFDPYAAGASGIAIQQGRLSLTSKISLGKDRLGAKSVVSLHQLAVSERESGWFQNAFGMPLDVALALLRDLQGDITLPVDVEQDEKGTQVGITAAVTAALRQALVGALAAPLKILGAVASTAGSALSSGLEPIPMEPGQRALGADEHERIDALAKLLASRPGLQVVLVGRADASDDPSLARQAVIERAQAGEDLPGQDELGFFERRRVRSALAKAGSDATGALDAETAAALERLASHVQVTDEARGNLALARAQEVAGALREEYGASADPVAGIQTGVGAPGVEIELRASNQ